MRAADDCHPLPDQLHPCSWFSWFCSNRYFYKFAAKKIDAFHDAFDRFRGETGFCDSRSIRSRSLGSFASPVSSPASALRFHLFGWLSELAQINSETLRLRLFRAPSKQRSFERALRAERRIERLVCSSSREGDANAAIRKQVPEIRCSCFRASFAASALPPITRKNMCHFTRRSFEAPSFEDLKPNLLRDSTLDFSPRVATPS